MKSFFIFLLIAFLSAKAAFCETEQKAIMQELVFSKAVRKIPKINFVDEVENNYDIKDFEGQIVILYFWASWCVECINELKRLDTLKSKLLYENVADIEIIPISIDFKQPEFLYSIYKNTSIANLGLFIDQNKKVMKTLEISGAPYTIILDKNLMEIMRTNQHIKWDKANIIDQLIKLRGGPVKKYQSDTLQLEHSEDLQKEGDNVDNSDIQKMLNSK
ncbi:MAG: TlpA family protein disulfide reductase [Candidatus Midichloria sp.]|nr:TlpA family protein disulfide reductase [Candidatus Midichloria sp.]